MALQCLCLLYSSPFPVSFSMQIDLSLSLSLSLSVCVCVCVCLRVSLWITSLSIFESLFSVSPFLSIFKSLSSLSLSLSVSLSFALYVYTIYAPYVYVVVQQAEACVPLSRLFFTRNAEVGANPFYILSPVDLIFQAFLASRLLANQAFCESLFGQAAAHYLCEVFVHIREL